MPAPVTGIILADGEYSGGRPAGGAPTSISLARAPGFASLQFLSGAPVLHLAPTQRDTQSCPAVITAVATDTANLSLPDALVKLADRVSGGTQFSLTEAS